MLTLFPDADQTVHGAAAALQAGTMSCTALLERCLKNIEQWESSVHAWVSTDIETARRTALELDQELADGCSRGPLHGIPIGIKDIFDVAGSVTAAGSQLWASHQPRTDDCPVVARLRQAGAVIVGKTVTTQFACFDPPATRNPWNLNHTPGGSSSGSAAAVATGMCLAAMGSQTGGSITRPAAFCGVAGCKPSFGTVSLEGIVPLAEHLDHPGPIARCVTDLAILLQVIRDSADTEGERHSSANFPRIGWLHGLFDDLADDDARSSVARAVEELSAAGAEVTNVEMPSEFDDILEKHAVVMAVEAAKAHAASFAAHPEDYRPAIKGLIERGQTTSSAVYTEAMNRQHQLRNRIQDCFAKADVLICPAATGAAPDVTSTGSPAMNSPWSFIGLPTVSFPVQCTADNLPLAVQLVGKMNADMRLLEAAIWCESRISAAHGSLITPPRSDS